MRFAKLFSIAILAFLIAGCAPPYRQAFSDAATQHGWNHRQELAAYAYADRIFWAKETKEGSDQYVFLYSRVPTSKVASQLKQTLDDFNDVQNPKNVEWTKYAEVYHLREDFKHEEEIERTIYARVHAADLENQLKVDLGDQDGFGSEAEVRQGYDIKRIFVNKPLNEAFPFKSDQIDGAKANGTLKPIEHVDLDLSSTLDHKDTNPANPEDATDFVWKPKTITIRMVNYKIIDTDKPKDNHGNYIEGTRVIDGKEESVPCLKIFFPPDGGMAIVLLETTREGEAGYGVPDILERLDGLNNVTDVIRNGDILDTLFQEKKIDARKIPPAKIFKVEISRLDEPISPWQQAPDATGFLVPLKYRSTAADNYNIRIKFKRPNVDINDTNAVVAAHDSFQDVEWIVKEYTKTGNRYEPSAGQVIEYYRPKAEFATHLKAHVVFNEDTKKVEFEFPDGTITDVVISPGSNKIIEDSPTAVAYTEGEKRYWMEKTEGSKVYDRRKQVSPPREQTGQYEDDTPIFDMAPTAGKAAGPTEGNKPIKP
ncbi:MAG: hypothetical protein WA766_14105 [Candidatus Acidiferrales bacterium]